MMHFDLKRPALIVALGSAVIVSAALATAPRTQPQQDECDCVFATPDEMDWQPGPASLPEGVEWVVLSGDPAQDGPFVMRLRFPADYRIPPHFHPADENVTVISGQFHMGKGEEFDTAGETYALPRGSFAMIPADDRHFAWTEEPTVVQLHGIGPWQIVYLNPDDDPRQ